MKKSSIVSVLFACLYAATAWAESQWTTVSSAKADAKAHEIVLNQAISKVAVTCLQGEITIHSVEVRGGTTPYVFALKNKLKKDESQQISVGDKIQCERLILVVDGQGNYDVKVRK